MSKERKQLARASPRGYTAEMHSVRILLFLLLPSLASAADTASNRFFEQKVRPLLLAQCVSCHGPDKQRGGLRLDTAAGVRKGGDLGPLVVPGKPDESLLLKAIGYKDDLKMPPKGKLAPADAAVLEAWARLGAPWPDAGPVVQVPTTPDITPAQRAFWAFKPPADVVPPLVHDVAWTSNPIDRFILAKLEQKRLKPAAPADRRTLVRRVAIDLTGLPPSYDEVRAAMADTSPDWYERVVERLLASPAYGERWGRHWLDVARYADSNGMDENLAHAHAWRWRDYVVASLNADKPYRDFVVDQLAGDLLPTTGNPAVDLERNVAVGFLSIGPKMLAEDDPVKMRMDIVDEQIDAVGQAFLGLTLGCARCHDHKFDPIPTSDYYGLAGIFRSTKTMDNYNVVARWHVTDLPFGGGAAMAVTEDKVENVRVHVRGSHLNLGAEVPRRFPRVLAGETQKPLPADRSGRRELAEWMSRDDHPLTSRVMVNRLWLWHFGEGLVRTPDNFGSLGERPSHPELLDWLAREFVRSGWSMKAMHRLLVMSSVYRCSTAFDETAARIDPDNRLLWRFPRRRLEAEALRDSVLAASGRLDLRLGGTLLKAADRAYVTGTANRNYDDYDSPRRSIYLPIIRSAVYDMFQAFDQADPSTLTGKRTTTTVAPQALFMMNGKLMHEETRHLAAEILKLPTLDDSARASRLHERILLRPADDKETARILVFLRRYQDEMLARKASPTEARLAAWQGLCRVLLSSNEHVYVE